MENLIGQVFGKLTVRGIVIRNSIKMLDCVCECGDSIDMTETAFLTRQRSNCGYCENSTPSIGKRRESTINSSDNVGIGCCNGRVSFDFSQSCLEKFRGTHMIPQRKGDTIVIVSDPTGFALTMSNGEKTKIGLKMSSLGIKYRSFCRVPVSVESGVISFKIPHQLEFEETGHIHPYATRENKSKEIPQQKFEIVKSPTSVDGIKTDFETLNDLLAEIINKYDIVELSLENMRIKGKARVTQTITV